VGAIQFSSKENSPGRRLYVQTQRDSPASHTTVVVPMVTAEPGRSLIASGGCVVRLPGGKQGLEQYDDGGDHPHGRTSYDQGPVLP
jgi:hypothetical protein